MQDEEKPARGGQFERQVVPVKGGPWRIDRKRGPFLSHSLDFPILRTTTPLGSRINWYVLRRRPQPE